MHLFKSSVLAAVLVSNQVLVSAQTVPVEWPKDAATLPLAGLFPITTKNNAINDEGYQLSEAFRCAVRTLNEANVLPGLPIEATVIDTKNDTAEASNRVSQYLGNDYLFPFYFSAPDVDVARAANTLLNPQNALLGAYISDGSAYTGSDSNLLKIYPDFSNQAKVLWRLIRGLGITNMGVITVEDDPTSVQFFNNLDSAVTISCRFPSVSISTIKDFGDCMRRSSIRPIVIFGSAATVAAQFAALVTYEAVSSKSLIIAPESWGKAEVFQQIIASGVSSSVFYGAVTLKPTTGLYGLYAGCLNKVKSSSYASATYSTAFANYWESTFKCKINTAAAPCAANKADTDTSCKCTDSMALNQALLYNKGVNYVIDSVFSVVNALAQIMYNCNNILPYVPTITDGQAFCNKRFYNGQDVATVAKALSFLGLTNYVAFNGASRTGYAYDYFQYDDARAKFVKIGNFSQATTVNQANPAYPIVVPVDSYTLAAVVLPQEAAVLKELTSSTFTLVDWNSSAPIAVAFFASLGILLSLITTAFIAIKASHPVIKKSSPLFCGIMLAGITLIYIDLYLWSGLQYRAICVAKIWVPIIGFSLMMGPLLAKTFRIWKIFDNSRLRNRKIMTSHLLGMTGVVVLINLILLIVWTAIDPLQKTNSVATGRTPFGDGYDYCGGNENIQTAFIIIFSVYNGLLLLLGGVLSFLVRNVVSSFNESKFIAYTMYNLGLVFVVMIPIYFTSGQNKDSVTRKYVVRSAAIIFANTLSLFILFAPKFYHVISGTEDKDLPTTGKSVSTGKKAAPSNAAGSSTAPTGKTSTLVGGANTAKTDATSAPGATFDDKSAVQSSAGGAAKDTVSGTASGFETSTYEPGNDKAGLISIEEREERQE